MPVTRTATVIARTVTTAPATPSQNFLTLNVGESKTYKFSIETCRYKVIRIWLPKGSILRVEWDSDRMIHVAVATKEELDTWLSSTLCLIAHTTFQTVFSSSNYGYSGEVIYKYTRAPYTGIHYAVVFTGWSYGTHIATISLTITRTS